LVAFAGNDSLLIAEEMCQDEDGFCDFTPTSGPFEIGTSSQAASLKNSAVRGLTPIDIFPVRPTAKWRSATPERRAIARPAMEAGETKVRVARFVLWDRTSRRTIAESPALGVERHSCFLAIGLGPCTSYERASELQMSDDGKTVLAFMPFTSDDPPDRKPRPLSSSVDHDPAMEMPIREAWPGVVRREACSSH
jgi:hypothetical protein